MDAAGPHRLLLVEDDTELSETLVEEGYVVDRATDGQRGPHLGLTRPYDVLVIDRMLPCAVTPPVTPASYPPVRGIGAP